LDISALPSLLASPKLPTGTWTHLASTIESKLQNAEQDVKLPGSLKNKMSPNNSFFTLQLEESYLSRKFFRVLLWVHSARALDVGKT